VYLISTVQRVVTSTDAAGERVEKATITRFRLTTTATDVPTLPSGAATIGYIFKARTARFNKSPGNWERIKPCRMITTATAKSILPSGETRMAPGISGRAMMVRFDKCSGDNQVIFPFPLSIEDRLIGTKISGGQSFNTYYTAIKNAVINKAFK